VLAPSAWSSRPALARALRPAEAHAGRRARVRELLRAGRRGGGLLGRSAPCRSTGSRSRPAPSGRATGSLSPPSFGTRPIRPALMVRVAPVRARSGDRILPALLERQLRGADAGERRSISIAVEGERRAGRGAADRGDGFNLVPGPEIPQRTRADGVCRRDLSGARRAPSGHSRYDPSFARGRGLGKLESRMGPGPRHLHADLARAPAGLAAHPDDVALEPRPCAVSGGASSPRRGSSGNEAGLRALLRVMHGGLLVEGRAVRVRAPHPGSAPHGDRALLRSGGPRSLATRRLLDEAAIQSRSSSRRVHRTGSPSRSLLDVVHVGIDDHLRLVGAEGKRAVTRVPLGNGERGMSMNMPPTLTSRHLAPGLDRRRSRRRPPQEVTRRVVACSRLGSSLWDRAACCVARAGGDAPASQC